MRRRCHDTSFIGHKNYGRRGIDVCTRWLDFENFLEDMGECPTGKSLDRINTNGNYEPSNCRWATRAEQNRNTRRTNLQTAFGLTQCLSDWESCARIPRKTFRANLRRGESMESIISRLGKPQ